MVSNAMQFEVMGSGVLYLMVFIWKEFLQAFVEFCLKKELSISYLYVPYQ